MYRIVKYIIYVFLILSLSSLFAENKHPFLLVDSLKMAEMVNNSSKEPWNTIIEKSQIIYENSDTIDITAMSISDCGNNMRDFMDAATLLYIVDTLHRDEISERIIKYLFDWEIVKSHEKWMNPDKPDWIREIPIGSGFFMSVIAYDIIYNTLTSEQVDSLDDILGPIASDFYNTKHYWPLNSYGTAGIWDVFKDTYFKDEVVNKYKQKYLSYLTEDGVFLNSVNYAFARMSSREISKSNFIDVLVHTGEVADFFENEEVIGFNNWIYESSLLPNRQHCAFGDSRGSRIYGGTNIFRAWKFGENIKKIANWRIKNHNYHYIGGLLNYIFIVDNDKEEKMPESKVYPSGGAFLFAGNVSNNSLYGALWNPKEVNFVHGHAHYDINSLHLGVYGETILRNVGYNGYGTGFEDFTWNDIHDQAWTNNVITTNGKNHIAKSGGGIVESLLSESLDYSEGFSGGSIFGHKHYRSLINLYNENNSDGYFLLFDKITTKYLPITKINLHLHPNGQVATEISENLEYDWNIDKYNLTDNEVKVSIFLGSEPDSVSIKKSPICMVSNNMVCDYLNAHYTTDGEKYKSLLTLVLPHDKSHQKISAERIIENDYLKIIANNDLVEDIFISPNSDSIITFDENKYFQGDLLIIRNKQKVVFVKNSSTLLGNTYTNFGFESDSPITLMNAGNKGKIVTSGTRIKFYNPNIQTMQLDSINIEIINSGNGFIEVELPAGKFSYSFGTSSSRTDEIISVNDFNLKQNYPNPFNPETKIEYQIFQESMVELNIYDISGRLIQNLVAKKQSPGKYHFIWNAGNRVSGVFFYQLLVNNESKTQKMILLK